MKDNLLTISSTAGENLQLEVIISDGNTPGSFLMVKRMEKAGKLTMKATFLRVTG
jgi:hypothetical protein